MENIENLDNKLSKVSDVELKKLVEEAKKIREELGDTPEIKNIERSIVSAQSYKNKKSFANGMRFLFGIACLGIGSYYAFSTGDQASFGTISHLVVAAVGASMVSNSNMTIAHEKDILADKVALIEKDFENARCANKSAEVEQNVRRR